MRISPAHLPKLRLAALITFFCLCATVFGYLWVNSGGRIPLVTQDGYQVSVEFPEVANLVHYSDVMVAGVKVGKVDDIETVGDRVKVNLRLDEATPLHEGATVQIRQKSLIEETYVEITDGNGAPLPSGSQLPPGSGKPLTRLDDVLASLDPKARATLAGSVQSLGTSTADSKQAIADAFSGLGHVGREGEDVLSALEAQTTDLREIAGQTAAVLASLNTRRGAIGQLVSDANALTKVTADGRRDIERIMHRLPATLDAARGASDDVQRLSADLRPVASDLRKAAPALSAALRELPATSRDLRGLLPSLDGVLDRAPATLERAPAVTNDLTRLVPTLRTDLADVNPMLAYLEPYGPDITAFFTNWGQSFANRDVNGHYLRLMLPIDEQTFRGYPFSTNIGPLDRTNPYPDPGTQTHPGPDDEKYPRIKREPR